MGDAFEDYAHALVERIARSDNGGGWTVKQPVLGQKQGEELAHSYLQRGEVAILLEHKAKRPGTEFLRGKEGYRVIGPSDQILEALDKGEMISIAHGHSEDKDFITRGMWQQTKVGLKVIDWARKEIGIAPKKNISTYN
ncbi:MAG: hypothetical protein JRJ70_15005 [Deltaproteobacteria bacterium]|nr:hypothetical protein [Deltaproteobacteria bacterium]MBW2149831.1 hypothetical protein [Deltaproteobacteria bacterium]